MSPVPSPGRPESRRAQDSSAMSAVPCPSLEESAGFWSRLLFMWLSPLLKVGFRRPLERGDIWSPSSSRSAHSLQEKLSRSLEQCLGAEKTRKRWRLGIPPLARAICLAFGVDFWLGGVCQLLESVLQAVAPFTLRFLITYAREANAYMTGRRPEPPSPGRGMAIVLAITAMQVAQSFSSSHFHYRSTLLGGQTRSALIAMSFAKSLRLSRRAKTCGSPDPDAVSSSPSSEGWSNSRIMTLISTDISRIEQSCGTFHLAWTSPVAIVITITFLLINLGYSALAGVAVLVAGLVGLTRVVRLLSHLRASINTVTDERDALTQEIVHGIRFVKYFGLEPVLLRRLRAIRASETRSLQTLHITKSAIGAVSMALPIFSSMAAFVVYSVVAADEPLNPATIFSSLALFNSLRTPMNWLPTAVGHIIDAHAALKKTTSLLLAEEAPRRPPPTEGMAQAFKLEAASFTWEGVLSSQPRAGDGQQAPVEAEVPPEPRKPDGGEAVFRLDNMSFTAQPGELVAVVGAVGSGKSSLLAALAGDMRHVSGTMVFGKTTAYCPQSPWLQNATVRDNITFGSSFDGPFYQRVVRACALSRDFDALPDGDLTEIGERGITLSGGQKQRINMARAIYSRASIVLLDDPLSAVDAHVGKHLLNEAICGLLSHSCRVLVTHQLDVLPRCDRVVWMVDGRLEMIGPYEELLRASAAFASFTSSAARTAPERESASSETEVEAPLVSKESPGESGGEPDATKETTSSGKGLMQDDVKAVDSVSWSVYLAWMRASGSLLNGLVVVLLQCLFRAANILTSLSLAWWVSDMYGLQRAEYIGLYAGLGVLQGLLLFVFSMVTCVVGTKASQNMSNQAMWRVLRAPMVFFDTTPLGRIIHRFTKDVDTMDNNLTDSFRQYLIVLSSLLGSFGLIIAFFHYFAVALAVVVVVLTLAVSYYRRTARELKRHHSILDGAVFSRFSEALTGAPTIRAYGRQGQYASGLHRSLDEMGGAYFLTLALPRWLSLRLDNLGNVLSFTTGVLVVTTTFSVPPSITGLILSYSLSLVGIIQITVRYLGDVDNSMSATERLYQYTASLEVEGSGDEDLDESGVSPSWPETGHIRFESVQMRYRPELPLVLDDFSLTIAGGERIGIVGRTGAGKSTILSTLFRLTELHSGRILLDGVDVAKVSLRRLRSGLAIIPQDPTLFRGTVRSNLDPLDKHTDAELWRVLRKAGLHDGQAAGGEQAMSLDKAVEAEADNFSLGQRQLLALARALLRDARVTLIDEGTSSVDAATDARIQEAIAREMGPGRTLIAIAHRLRTVLLYDRVCVMDAGRIAELGPPFELWERAGLFRGMCDQSGITREDFHTGSSGPL